MQIKNIFFASVIFLSSIGCSSIPEIRELDEKRPSGNGILGKELEFKTGFQKETKPSDNQKSEQTINVKIDDTKKKVTKTEVFTDKDGNKTVVNIYTS